MISQPAALDDGQNQDGADELALSRACAALWVATLSLMTAFMQTPAPAHRYLIARRIARNLGTLREQDCFTRECRMIFSKLSQRWNAKAEQLAKQEDRPRGGIGLHVANA
ncbi:MAG: hypothetical protein ACXWJM_01575 [Ramlibacter sp.]